MWNRDLKIKSTLILGTALLGYSLLIAHGMRFDYFSAGKVIGTVGLLLPFSVVFSQRRIDTFANLLTGFLCMVVFNLFLTILIYAAAPVANPLADPWLMSVDDSLGVHLPSIVEWTRAHPTFRRILDLAYVSVLPSTVFAIVILGFDRDLRRLREFVLHFILGGLLTAIVFMFLPAEGPFAAYGYQLRVDQQHFLEHFHALRAGNFPVVSMSNLEGLITFPSFHTTWALLIAYAFRHYRWFFLPMLVLNVAVVVATMTTGWHYAADVLGGLLTATAAILLAKLIGQATADVAPADREMVVSPL